MLSFCARRYGMCSALVLVLAAWNLGYRLDRTVVQTWDESLYGTSAAELLASGDWVVTTFHGQVDYYNAKPPLNVWLIALSFATFGINLVSLRLVSVLSAWLTILVVQWWCRCAIGASAALAASLVLSTLFAFFFLHAGRSGNPDAMFTLFITLTAFALWRGEEHPFALAWIGPLLGLSFLLKGMGFLLPLAIVVLVLMARGGLARREWPPMAAGVVVGAAGGVAWGAARYVAEGGRFFRELVFTDFVARVAEPLDRHGGGLLYYLDALQRDHYDWLAAAAVVLTLAITRAGWARLRGDALGVDRRFLRVVAIWGGVTLGVPTAMSTKLGWYLNPFYPAFAIAVGWTLAWGLTALAGQASQWRWRAAVAILALAAVVAEGKLLWYAHDKRSIGGTPQGLILSVTDMAGARVFRQTWEHSDRFVLEHMRGGRAELGGPAEFLASAMEGDLLLADLEPDNERLAEVRRGGTLSTAAERARTDYRGICPRTSRGCFAASGVSRETCSGGTRMGVTSSVAAPTTCSRSTASGWRRVRWRSACSCTPWCGTPRSSA